MEPPLDKTPASSRSNHPVISKLAIVFIVFMAIAILLTIIITYRQSWVVSQFNNANHQIITHTFLHEDQKEVLLQRLQGLANDVNNSLMHEETLHGVTSRLHLPLNSISLLVHLNEKQIQTSELSDAEKSNLQRTIERLTRGVFDDRISYDKIDALTEPLLVAGSHDMTIKQPLTATEWRTLATRAQALADEAGIPDEPYPIDLVAEVNKVIDQTLKDFGD